MTTFESTQPGALMQAPTRSSALRRTLVACWKWFVGVLLCNSAALSVLVVGWTGRVMRRTALKTWHRRAGLDAIAGDSELSAWPNWVLGQNAAQLWHGDQRTGEAPHRTRALLGSFIDNLRLGLGLTLNTWVLTLPACALWLFAWEFGWNVSFHKVYEQSGIGAITGAMGSLLFIAAMLYVPMAQARHATTGDWRAFYDFKLVWRLVRRRWGACLTLAAFYGLLSVPVMVFRVAPKFLDRIPNYEAIKDDPAALIAVLNGYFFWVSVFLFTAYVALRIFAARIYAGAVASGVKDGSLPVDQLGAFEHRALDRLDLLAVDPPRKRHALVKAAGWTGTLAGRWTTATASVVIWFLVVASIFVADFFNHIGGMNWLNQPLIQLPWLKYIPPALLGN